ncbi:hypothetical protein KAZ01_03740, partial [Candidatus Gracilibacteria bacterium]|nr:hypothetical protein [Candidatus Gracilibacteria bacterium]
MIVKENGKEVKKEIALGITDDANIEVIEGLSLGDTIIKKITYTVSTSASLFNGPGGNRNS